MTSHRETEHYSVICCPHLNGKEKQHKEYTEENQKATEKPDLRINFSKFGIGAFLFFFFKVKVSFKFYFKI
jgi:hypothetical protein